MFPSRFLPCPECGASVERSGEDRHECDTERLLDFQMFQLRDEVAQLEPQFEAFLASPSGRFERWLGWHQVTDSGPLDHD